MVSAAGLEPAGLLVPNQALYLLSYAEMVIGRLPRGRTEDLIRVEDVLCRLS